MIDDMKMTLRIKTTAFDDEINDLIDSAKKDLEIAGVAKVTDTDPMIKTTIAIYLKAYFGESEHQERYLEIYNMRKNQLCLSGDYNA